jgi:proteasome lid subunit RPN8/RPN11
LAWLKLVYFCHAGDTEVGGFGICASHDYLYVEDFVTVGQRASAVSVRLLDEAVADHFEAMYDRGVPPSQCGRIWCHTHPGVSARPSNTDEATFARSFGACDWAVMMILARGGARYARLTFRAGPHCELAMAVRVDWPAWPSCLPTGSISLDARCALWMKEYDANVQPYSLVQDGVLGPFPGTCAAALPWWAEEPWLPEYPLDQSLAEETCPDLIRDSSKPAGG